MIKTFLLLFFLIVFSLAGTNSCSQSKSTFTDTLLYIGSTPCDSLIQSMLGLRPDPKCEFIKWRFNIYRNVDSPGRFQLTVVYGEGQPNTNGFKNGGNRMELTGTYTVHKGTPSLPKSNVYELHNSQAKSSIWLVQIDDNIFHFADSKNNLIVGNGGWGYVLNRFKK